MNLKLLSEYNNVAIIGGGGKTSLMELMQKEALAAGRAVLVSTTTRLGRGQLGHLQLVEASCLQEAIKAAKRAKAGEGIVLTLSNSDSPDKLSALPSQWFAAVRKALGEDAFFIVEADGSRSMPLKAHEAYEPVLPPLRPLSVLAVLGLGALLEDWELCVHRPDIFVKVLGTRPHPGQCLTPEQVALFVIRAWSGFMVETIILNQADLLLQRDGSIDKARRLAGLLADAGFNCLIASIINNKIYDMSY